MADQPWYREGLRFGCRQCGRCCIGEPGYVWVTEEEMAAMAAGLGLSQSLFAANFARNVGDRKSLVELPNGDCIFFDDQTRGCKVYETRPTQCRTWPFWDSNIDTAGSWKKTAKFCPGCNMGELHSLEEIEAKRGQIEV
ncbi:MAG: YkgJ family cysteine cluster protein [Planctomycetaceae bacterium]|nr:YkgJ family cysteine cluster protein [Planctomycetaceae bacterium]